MVWWESHSYSKSDSGTGRHPYQTSATARRFPALEALIALSIDEVRHIARLARIALSDEEVERMQGQLSSILDHFEVLSEIDTEGVPPTAQSFDLTNVERADVPGGTTEREIALEAAPRREDGYFRVRAVLD